MNTKLRYIIGILLAVIFVDLLIIGVKIFDGNYDIVAEGAVGIIGFTIIGCCGIIGSYREIKKRADKKKGKL